MAMAFAVAGAPTEMVVATEEGNDAAAAVDDVSQPAEEAPSDAVALDAGATTEMSIPAESEAIVEAGPVGDEESSDVPKPATRKRSSRAKVQIDSPPVAVEAEPESNGEVEAAAPAAKKPRASRAKAKPTATEEPVSGVEDIGDQTTE